MPIGGRYEYRGNHYTIEGLYQKKASTNSSTATGLFSGSCNIKDVTIKNYFGIGKNMENLSVMGDAISMIQGCKGEDIQLISVNDAGHTNAGFVGTLSGLIQDTDVEANIFSPSMTQNQQNNYSRMNSLGILVGKIGKGGARIENCHTSGRIGNEKQFGYSVGGIVGYSDLRSCSIDDCDSDAVLEGNFFSVGGIVGGNATLTLTECRFYGRIQMNGEGTDPASNFVGGICGNQEMGSINQCTNYGTVQGDYGFYGGIVGRMESGEIANCINEGVVKGTLEERALFDGKPANEDGDCFAGGIVGHIYAEITSLKKGASVLNCGNRGQISSRTGPAGGICGYQKGGVSAIANVWSMAEVESGIDADYVAGTWVSGNRENCLDGRESNATVLCEKLNSWLAVEDMEDFYTMDDISELYPWQVVEGKLQLKLSPPPSATASPTPTVKPTEAATASPTPTAKPTEAATASPTPTVKPTEAATASPSQSPSPTKKPVVRSTPAPQKKKWKAPVFTLRRKKTSNGQSYILVTVKKHKGSHVEVWAKIGKRKYRKIKLSKNRLSAMKNKLRFKYSFSGKKIYFKLRTYKIQNGKKVYSKKSKAKGIMAK